MSEVPIVRRSGDEKTAMRLFSGSAAEMARKEACACLWPSVVRRGSRLSTNGYGSRVINLLLTAEDKGILAYFLGKFWRIDLHFKFCRFRYSWSTNSSSRSPCRTTSNLMLFVLNMSKWKILNSIEAKEWYCNNHQSRPFVLFCLCWQRATQIVLHEPCYTNRDKQINSGPWIQQNFYKNYMYSYTIATVVSICGFIITDNKSLS